MGWSEAQNSQDENYNGPGRLEEKKKKAQAEMQCKSAQGKRDEPAEALAEGRGGHSVGHGEGY